MHVAPLAPVTLNDQMALPLFLHAIMPESDQADNDETAMEVVLEDELLRRPGASFCTYAKGDSLAELGIFDGDLLIVDRDLKPQDGDLVIACVDGELLCRQLDMKESCLRTADSEQPPIFLNDQVALVIEGVIMHSVHRHR